MLEQFFNDSAVERLRGGPLGPYVQSFAASLASLGYATFTARVQIGFLDELCQWLVTNQIRVTNIDEQVVEAFLDERRRAHLLRRGESSTLQRFVDHLRHLAVIPPRKPAIPDTALALLEGRYERYLRVERGLTTATVINYLPFVRRLLVERFGDAELKLRKLRSKDISSFVLGHAHSMSPGRAKLMVTAFRSFFQYLLYCGDIEVDLAASVPTVANWRLSSVPKYLTPAELQRVLGACSQSTPTGRRDYAILVLLARLGLRASEILTLNLDDINWRAGEITVPGKGLVRENLPLPVDVGRALANYLRRDRPPCGSRRVFLRTKAPRRGLAHASTVSTIVRRAVERAGLNPAVKGAHLLRHSLATGMLRRGASLVEIGQVLRHRTPNTTEIYAKVDFDGLRLLARPWPETGGAQ